MSTKKNPEQTEPTRLALKPGQRVTRNGNIIESQIGDPKVMTEQFVRAADIKPTKSKNVRRLVFGGPMSGGRDGGVL